MPLVFLPDVETLFLWGPEPLPRSLSSLTGLGTGASAVLVTPGGPRECVGRGLPLAATVERLAVVSISDIEGLPGSLATWTLASKLALDLLARERVVPTLVRASAHLEARWAAALSASEDSSRLVALARSMPAAAHAVPVLTGRAPSVWAPEALLRAFVDATVDSFVRAARGGPTLPARAASRRPASWDERWRAALTGPRRDFAPEGFAERFVADELERWSEPALGARDRLRACFRLELPTADREPFTLSFHLQAPDDPSLLVSATDVWKTRGHRLEKLGRAFRAPQESLLEALARAARLFAPIGLVLESPRPHALLLEPDAAWTFLSEGARVLADAGFGVILPGELTSSGRRRLRLRMRVGASTKAAGVVEGSAGLGLDALLRVDWDAVLGDTPLSAQELALLAERKAPLVRFRGEWVAVDPHELDAIQRHLAEGPGRMVAREAVRVALLGETRHGSLPVTVTATGALEERLGRLRSGGATAQVAPLSLRATLRPYQSRGLHWLDTLASLGLGACLADDMGLGKTVQILAFLLRRLERSPRESRPTLLVAPTSVVGNWEREVARFAPSLRLTPHYGAERARTVGDMPQGPGSLVLTTYGLLRRDAELLARVDWATVVLDEAQNIKNAASATARAARALRSSERFALTGTPVENRLAELWSILEFANPGLLGPLETFRRELALPIERHGNPEAAQRLRRIVGPFVLRRLKSDPAIISDLPAKNEMKVVCTLTREQASLYKAVVDEELRRIEESDGIERRGRVLALLLFTKQIANHPAQYLGESGPLPGRSGKLARVTEMLEEALSAGDKALVFTQFREMGDKLVAHLSEHLGHEVVFLHGGTSQRARDELVRRFQDEPHGPRVFVLSVKAGGTGLNLTAASHVFHYDRWWNPAVEDQATDRAYRIGQRRAVQVHKLVCAGTVEEKIDVLLERKRQLAERVVGTGEHWVTELDTAALRELFSLSSGAVADEGEAEGEPARRRKPRGVARGKGGVS
ncbi:SNF2/helicase domain-containing protein [Myxococcus stipitatus DSM 14675]|uniref:SNF2/helicase domain-containing protein n=1 Tax=Myxococcus stipitatus (strain DSM 14675 / JCM 12634 / Mx s8) TaxID=1278073 RepID=L7UJN4_MYXSD|nr:DEAD/DEAH box helicase [Myxococcus stipitatus]AGC49211.1 SNF2/helicase domain-containing protein [Myxococcus stipitatus DSM 14675]